MSSLEPFKLKSLPYPEDALEPAIGRETVSIHYHKHHGGYVSKLNDALAEKGGTTPTLEAVIANARREQDQKVFNLAAQIWNHDFYWASMTPERTTPDSILNGQIERGFSSMAKFEEAFKTAAENQFGIERFLERLINWDTVGERLAVAAGRSEDADLRRAAR